MSTSSTRFTREVTPSSPGALSVASYPSSPATGYSAVISSVGLGHMPAPMHPFQVLLAAAATLQAAGDSTAERVPPSPSATPSPDLRTPPINDTVIGQKRPRDEQEEDGANVRKRSKAQAGGVAGNEKSVKKRSTESTIASSVCTGARAKSARLAAKADKKEVASAPAAGTATKRLKLRFQGDLVFDGVCPSMKQ